MGTSPIEEAFWTNLLLLGFDKNAFEKQYNIPFDRGMFRVSNVTGMEILLYFLFGKISPEQTREKFKFVWPIVDKKRAHEFKTLAHSILLKLENDAKLPVNTVRASLLQTCSGERFYRMMWHISNYALQCTLEREHPSFVATMPHTNAVVAALPTTDQQLFSAQIHALKLQISIQARKFLEWSQHSISAQTCWQQAARYLEQEYFELRDRLAAIEREREQLEPMLNREIFSASSLRQRNERIEKLRTFWAVVDKYFTVSAQNKEMIDSILTDEMRSCQLSAKDLKFDVAQLRSLFDESATLDKIADQQSNNSVELTDFVDIWLLAMKKLQSVLSDIQQEKDTSLGQNQDNPVTNRVDVETTPLNIALKKLRALSEQHQMNVDNLAALNKKLQMTISQLRESVEELQEHFEIVSKNGTFHMSSATNNGEFRLVPLTTTSSTLPAVQQDNESLPTLYPIAADESLPEDETLIEQISRDLKIQSMTERNETTLS